MKLIVVALIVGLLTSGFYLAASSSAEDRERERGKGRENEREGGRGHSIESIMKTVHGKRGLMKSLGTLLEAKDINWNAVQAITKQILPLAVELGKRKPDKGTKQSWADLTDIYAENATELAAAATKKNIANTKAFFNELNTSCNKCHARHKGEDD